MIHFERIGAENDTVLRNLSEHYVHDMSEWFGVQTHADGKFSYDTSVFWKGDFAVYLAKSDDNLAGFAVVGSADRWLGRQAARDVKDFFVLRAHRGKNIAETMARFIWDEFPAEWLVRVLPSNKPAVPFWRRAIRNYKDVEFVERRVTDEGRDCIHLHFDNSRGAGAK
jgi:predicted acetyltransferase